MSKQRDQSTSMAIGAGGGVLVGSVIGILTNNIGLWIAVGIAIGVAVGLALASARGGDPDDRAHRAPDDATVDAEPDEAPRSGDALPGGSAGGDDGLPGDDPEATGRPWRPGDPR